MSSWVIVILLYHIITVYLLSDSKIKYPISTNGGHITVGGKGYVLICTCGSVRKNPHARPQRWLFYVSNKFLQHAEFVVF